MGNDRFNAILSISAFLILLISGCGSMDHVPFFGAPESDLTGQPKDAVRYVCKSGKGFYVHLLNKDNAAWVTFPDREVRFEKAGDKPGARYINGTAVLEINGTQAGIQDGMDDTFTDCTTPTKK